MLAAWAILTPCLVLAVAPTAEEMQQTRQWAAAKFEGIPCWDMRDKDLNYDLMRRLAFQWRSVAPYYFRDYYPLTPYSLANDVWMAWQFDRPEQGDGMVQAFRRAESTSESARLILHALEPDAVYTLTNLDESTPAEMTGRELCEEGLPVEIRKRPGAEVITYKKKT
ncbi:MAG: GH36 C-terminal domain-containing protein [Phycisphaerae bacterium]|nr:GH36 C-terminal domain-containing protein [Phycisphaerae bacterium]